MRYATTRPSRRLAGALWLPAILWAMLWATPASGNDIYVYEDSDGSRLITDHPRIEPGFRLVRVYSESKIYRQAGVEPQSAVVTRPSDYDHLIASAARQASLDPLLIKSVMHAESAFNPNAVSKKGASGLMQLMPGTAKRYGVSRIFDPQDNVLGGARYLSDLLDLFKGDLKLALAGYNAGENAVLKRGGVPPYTETRRYISRVMRLYRAYQGDRCQKHRRDLNEVEGTIISCSGSTSQSTGSIGVSSLSTQETATAEVSSRNTLSSADDGAWRVVK